MAVRIPAAPRGLGAAGKHLYRSVLSDFDLAPHELAILVEACHTRDAIAELQREITREGVSERISFSEVRPRAALREIRQQRLVYVELRGQLKINDASALSSSEPKNTRHRPRQRLSAAEGA